VVRTPKSRASAPAKALRKLRHPSRSKAFVENEQMRRGWTPLMQAIVDGDHTVAITDVDAIAEGAVSALSLACERGDTVWVDRLLAAGADVDVRAENDRTVLHLAAPHGVALVDKLLAAGARIDDDADNASPLASTSDLAVIERLLRAPGSDRYLQRAFEAACARGDLPVMRLLRPHAEKLDPSLVIAARHGRVEAARYLLDEGATQSFDLKEERSPLMHAAQCGQLAIARLLIERGADVNAMTEWFVTALSCARDQAMVDLLVAHGAMRQDGEPIHIVTPYATYSNLPLAMPTSAPRPAPTDARAACRQPDPWLLRDLLEAGAPADPPRQGWEPRPLDLAIYAGRAAHIALLLEHGADVGPDINGRTPLMLAASYGYVRCACVLADHDPVSITAAMFEAVDYPRLVTALVERGADPLATNRHGDTLLHCAAWSPRVAIDRYLEIAGSHIATRGRLGWTPLHAAAMAGSADTIAKLVAAGASRDARDDDGRTPRDLATEYPRPGILEALA
jgi:ankyrin repeat protein